MTAANLADVAYDDFEELIRVIATAPAIMVGRGEAMRWSEGRSLLLDGGYREILPGFVIQCGSVFKYRDFISLYDPAPAKRLAFVEAALAPARARRNDRAGMAFPPPPTSRQAPSDWVF